MKSLSVAWITLSAFLVTVGTNAAVFTESYPGASFNYVNAFGQNDSSRGVYHTPDTFTDSVDPTVFSMSLLPSHPQFLTTPDSAVNFQSVLSLSFPNWTFNYMTNGNDLALGGSPSLTARTYSTFTNDGVGAELYLGYTPGASDPKGAGVHWIQVVSNNWSIAFDFSGVATNFVDTKIANSPFYDNGNTGYDATTNYFDDIPKRPRIGLTNYNGTPITWLGEAFLVQDLGTNGLGGDTVNIYDGVKWGWQIVPEPYTLILTGLALVILVGTRRRSRESGS
jgi:hypothetical protein